MEVLVKPNENGTPSIILNKEEHYIEFTGKALPEDAKAVYQPIIDWLIVYPANTFPELTMKFKLKCYNSASSKYFIDMLAMLDKLNEHGMKANVEWYYKNGDEDMMLEGQDIQEILQNTEVKLVEY
ncbi:MAG: hypothetical protein COC01_02210 [Bacteroidetes bacterium]|nr:MAG: hypothetical protein COC01_02210 [Bacteroidota bacterium]